MGNQTIKNRTKFHIKAAPIEEFTATKIYSMKFHDAAFIIAKMDTMRKAVVASEAKIIVDSLYEAANRFGNADYPADEQPTQAQFRGIIGKIKHWETILFWLYEIDIMMEAEDLFKLAMQAEEDLAEYEAGQRNLTEKQLDKRCAIIDRANNHMPKTQEILDMATQLTMKYFKAE